MSFNQVNTIQLNEINKKLDYLIKILNNESFNIQDNGSCKNCPNYPENGGSGNCNCTLCDPKITC